MGEVAAGSDATPRVKGRMKDAIDFWSDTLEASEFVLNIIREGYRLPFSEYPSKCCLRNNLSARRHGEFVAQAIIELLDNDCIVEHRNPPYCVNPLTVAEGKKLRLVIDLRHVNEYLVKPNFKYEDLRSLSQVIEEGHWFFTWDLKSGYHHVDICSEHQKYLGFSWVFADGRRRYFTFAVLPFGLSTACFCFTKLLRPLVTRWRSLGHTSFVYLDDGFGSEPDKIRASAASIIQSKDLKNSGLLCNEEKSHWHPRQIGEWLGFIINTISMTFLLPDKKVTKLKNLIDIALSDGHFTYRFLARIAGCVVSSALAIGPMARLLTRQMYQVLESRLAWDATVFFNPALREELQFWYTNLQCFNGYRIAPPISCCTATLFSDASDVAFGGHSTLDVSVVSGMWTEDDIGRSSTYRELKAIYYVCISYISQLKGKRVKIFTDNQGAARIVSVGSTRPDLQQIALNIFKVCLANDFVLEAEWIPRECNQRADLLSRYIDKDDWAINPRIFRMLDAKWGPHTFDRFASYYNTQLQVFNSRFACPGCSGVDAFAQDWSGENNWLCPPVNLVVPTVKKLRVCRGKGTLIIPEWPSALFWPYLLQSPMKFKPFVKEVVTLPKLQDLLVEGPGQATVYTIKKSLFTGCPRFSMLALCIDFTS